MGKKQEYNCPKCGGKMIKNGRSCSGKMRYICYGPGGRSERVPCYSTVNPGRKATTRSGREQGVPAQTNFKRALGGVKKLVITSAQNATPVNQSFLDSLLTYCEANDAELIVIPYRYKNPTSTLSESQRNEEHWAPELTPYLYNQRKKLSANLILLADIKTQPTAISPLTGFEGITHGESGIIGHPKVQMRTIPTPSHALPKIMHTTGSLTVSNYSDTRAGKKGEFNHVFGAVVVEVVGKKFHLRQINACSDGSFIDWDTKYTGLGTSIAEPALALVMGDTHYRFMDPKVKEATFGNGGIVDQLKPKHLVWHDLFDGFSINHHERADPFVQIAKRQNNLHFNDVEQEVRDTVAFLDSMTREKKCKSIVVPSNHGDFLRRWLVDSDWRLDADNARFYLETALALVKSAKMGPGGAEYSDPFAYWVRQLSENNKNIHCPGVNESFSIAGIECAMHGHKGPNGARGTVKNLSTIGVKAVTGHGHSPAIEGGHYRAATSSSLNLSYAEGPSSWLNGHVIIYSNGKRSHCFIIEGRFRG